MLVFRFFDGNVDRIDFFDEILGLLGLLVQLMVCVFVLELEFLILLLQGSDLCLLPIDIGFEHGDLRHQRVVLLIKLGDLCLELLL